MLIIVDHLGKWVFSLPYKKEVNAEGAAKLYYYNIFYIFSVPKTATLDRGP